MPEIHLQIEEKVDSVFVDEVELGRLDSEHVDAGEEDVGEVAAPDGGGYPALLLPCERAGKREDFERTRTRWRDMEQGRFLAIARHAIRCWE